MKEGYREYLQGVPTYTSLYNEKEVIAILTNWWNTNFDGLASAVENTLFAIIVKEKYIELANYLTACYLANQSPDMLSMLRNGSLLKIIENTTKKLNDLITKRKSIHYMRDETLRLTKEQLENNKGRR